MKNIKHSMYVIIMLAFFLCLPSWPCVPLDWSVVLQSTVQSARKIVYFVLKEIDNGTQLNERWKRRRSVLDFFDFHGYLWFTIILWTMGCSDVIMLEQWKRKINESTEKELDAKNKEWVSYWNWRKNHDYISIFDF